MFKFESLRRFFKHKYPADEAIMSSIPDEPVEPVVTFGISLASAMTGNWAHTCQMLEYTLSCVLGQTDSRLRVLIYGHEKPASYLLDDPRVEFIECSWKRPEKTDEYRFDKKHKRLIIGNRLRELGGGYFMPLDADDLVCKDLVEYVLRDDNKTGYSIRQGYALDWNNRRLAPVPGAWDATFDQVCGSSAVFYFNICDLPVNGIANPDIKFNAFIHHAYWRVTSQELGRPLADIPFPAAIYVLNHSDNLSFKIQRNNLRQQTIIKNILQNQISEADEVYQRFSLKNLMCSRQ